MNLDLSSMTQYRMIRHTVAYPAPVISMPEVVRQRSLISSVSQIPVPFLGDIQQSFLPEHLIHGSRGYMSFRAALIRLEPSNPYFLPRSATSTRILSRIEQTAECGLFEMDFIFVRIFVAYDLFSCFTWRCAAYTEDHLRMNP